MTQLKDTAEADSRLVIKPNRAYQIIGMATIVFLALSVVATVNKDRASAVPQANSGVDQALLFVVIVIVGIILLFAIYRPMRVALNWGTFVFDRNSRTFSVDGETIGRLSDIKKVKVNKVNARKSRFYTVEIILKNRDSVQINTYMLNDSAMSTAERISSFLGVPEDEKEISEW